MNLAARYRAITYREYVDIALTGRRGSELTFENPSNRHGSTGWVQVGAHPPKRFKKQNWEKHFKRKFMWGYVRRPCTYQLTDVTVERYQCILLALYNCGQDADNHSIVCAGLYHKLSQYSFIVDIVVFHKIMSLLENLSTSLQSSTMM